MVKSKLIKLVFIIIIFLSISLYSYDDNIPDKDDGKVKIAKLINKIRFENDIMPLKLNDDISRICEEHSQKMAEDKIVRYKAYLDEKSADSNKEDDYVPIRYLPFTEKFKNDIKFNSLSVSVLKVTVDVNYPDMVVHLLKNKKIDLNNIYNKNYNEIGIGLYEGEGSDNEKKDYYITIIYIDNIDKSSSNFVESKDDIKDYISKNLVKFIDEDTEEIVTYEEKNKRIFNKLRNKVFEIIPAGINREFLFSKDQYDKGGKLGIRKYYVNTITDFLNQNENNNINKYYNIETHSEYIDIRLGYENTPKSYFQLDFSLSKGIYSGLYNISYYFKEQTYGEELDYLKTKFGEPFIFDEKKKNYIWITKKDSAEDKNGKSVQIEDSNLVELRWENDKGVYVTINKALYCANYINYNKKKYNLVRYINIPDEIEANALKEKVLDKIKNKQDRVLVLSYYKLNIDKTFYYLEKGIDSKAKKTLSEILYSVNFDTIDEYLKYFKEYLKTNHKFYTTDFIKEVEIK